MIHHMPELIAFLNICPSGILIMDMDSKMLFATRQVKAMLGETDGHSLGEYIAEGQPHPHNEVMRSMAEGQAVEDGTVLANGIHGLVHVRVTNRTFFMFDQKMHQGGFARPATKREIEEFGNSGT